MKIAGIQTCSMVDYPGHLAAVVFSSGCNWDCFFCHNRGILGSKGLSSGWDPEIFLGWLDERRGFLDAVVITGGEPTLRPGLTSFIREVREKGYKVKLDTNGTRPEVLSALLNERLLDYVAMDIKAPIEKYSAFCGVPVDHDAVNESIDLLLDGGVPHEFRTTVVPQLSQADIFAIARRIRGAQKFVLQQYRPPQTLIQDPRLEVPPHPADWPRSFLDELASMVRRCETRGFDLSARAAQPPAA